MRPTHRLHRRLTPTLILLLSTGACDGSPTAELDPQPRLHLLDASGIVFMTQNAVPDATMDALFEGRIVPDEAGCLRLDPPEPATVAWPHGYGLRTGADGARIVDEEGRTVGTLDGTFRLGGGEVADLSEAMGFSTADRELARSRCPGRYWIVG